MVDDGKSDLEIMKISNASWRYGNSLAKYRKLVECDQRTGQDREVEVYVLARATGCGKTRTAVRKGGEAEGGYYLLHAGDTKWWDGYSGQEVLIVDEWNNDKPLPWLLKMCDRYPVRLEIKGGCTWANWNRVYITTNLTMNEFHPRAKPAHLQAFNRRLTEWCAMDTDETFPEVTHDAPPPGPMVPFHNVVQHVE